MEYHKTGYLKKNEIKRFGVMKDVIENLDQPEIDAIAKRLRELRIEKNYSNYEHIAFDLGMSRSAYWRLEKGTNFQIKTLIKVCKLLDVTLEDFFKGIKLPKK